MSINLVTNPDGTSSFRDTDNQLNAIELDGKKGAYVDPANFVQLYDDFLGDVLEDGYSGAGGSDAQALAPAINAQAGGVVRLVAGDSNTSAAADGSMLTHALNWQADQGGLYLKTRVKAVTSAADFSVFVGFTDALGTTAVEQPISLSGTTLTTTATDAIGFLFDTDATNDTIHIQGVANDTDTALNNTGLGLTADTWYTLEISIDTSGNAEMFINGVSYGTVASAVTADVALSPVVFAGSRTTATKTLDVDYLFVAGQRPA